MLYLLFSLIVSFSFAANEPTIMNPVDDAVLIKSFQLADSTLDNRVNILVIGLDTPGENPDQKLRNPRQQLTSRTDIMSILSFDKITKKITIFAYGRDMELDTSCSERVLRSGRGDKLFNATYVLAGRRVFVKCIEQVTVEFINSLGNSQESLKLKNELLQPSGTFKLHAIFEGTRNDTVANMKSDIKNITVNSQKWFLSTTYGLNGLSALTKVLVGRYLEIELKERKLYLAGSYERAFNNATMLGDALSWIAYGIQQNKGRPFFTGEIFGSTINKNFSRTTDFVTLERQLVSPDNPNDNLMRYAGYINGVSPVRVIQWGEGHGLYAIYENGQLRVSKGSATMLRSLKYIQILPQPPTCNECHQPL